MTNHLQQFLAAFILVSSGFVGTTHGQDCTDGLAGTYPCQDIHQHAFLTSEEIGGGVINDNWGWVSPESNREYAIQGRSSGTSFIDITDPANPVYLGNLPTHDAAIVWRDIKVYNHHAFIVAESPNHGMQVFDLTQLDDVSDPPVEFEETVHYPLFGNAHNIAINESSGYAYVVGSNTFAGGLHFIDIQNPTDPVPAGGFESDGYTHDVQVVTYQGDDLDYFGNEMAFASNENSLTIVDVTDKADPQLISRTEYDSSAYAHQGWLTDDHRYFLMDDELDEGTWGINTKTFVWDLEDLDDPQLVGHYSSGIKASDHNLYIKGNYCYQANYTGGLRVLQLNNLATLDIEEVAYFDVFPESNDAGFTGAWNVYPYFPSGTMIVSSMGLGFHVLQPDFEIITGLDDAVAESSLSCYPNPAQEWVRISGVSADARELSVYDLTGKLITHQRLEVNAQSDVELDVRAIPSGVYVVKAGPSTAKLILQ